MDGLITAAEHMGTSYLWRANKRSQRAHIENPKTGRAYCQAENCSGGKAFDSKGPRIPDGRSLCRNCTDLAGRDEPELFAGTGAPEQPKRRKRVNRPKAHRPKRSNVKYVRPFNDDLPG